MTISFRNRWLHALASAAVLGLGGFSSPAIADDYRTYIGTGTISGIDTLGLFGAKGTDLNGATYKLNTVVDYSLLSSFTNTINQPGSVVYDNGVMYCCSSNDNFRFYLTVNGESIDLTSYFQSIGQTKVFDFVNYSNRIVTEISGKIDQNFDYGSVNSGFSGNGLDAAIYTNVYHDNLINLNTSDGSIYLNFNSNQVFKFALNGGYAQVLSGIVLPAPAVPEPETWAMMLAGMGMVGLLARRRQRVAKA